MSTEFTAAEPLVFCVPVYDDWESAAALLKWLDAVVADIGVAAGVLVVDDGSGKAPAANWPDAPIKALAWVRVLEVRRNVGHQRAIALGLTYIHQHIPCGGVVVMDSDGEDAPSDVPRLLDEYRRHDGRWIVFAKRARRSEGLTFRAGYAAYKLIYRAMTGRVVEVGNFSVLPKHALDRLVGIGEIWNHYAAAIAKSRLPNVNVPIDRGTRLAGRSRMNFTSLIIHGLSAISVFGDEIGVRLLLATCGLGVLAIGGLAGVIAVRLGTNLAIPGWATTAGGVFLVLFVNSLLLTFAFIFIILQTRSMQTFLPLRDYSYFVLAVREVASHE